MAVANVSYPPIHDSQGTQTNPTTSTVMADTGACPSAMYEVRIFVGASAAAIFEVQVRDAANASTNQDASRIRAAAGQTGEYVYKFHLNTNERVRVMMAVNLTGDAEATVQAIRIG